jgi:hypothetical protein
MPVSSVDFELKGDKSVETFFDILVNGEAY